VCVAEDVPRVGSRDVGEEVVRVTEEHAWFVARELGVEDQGRGLRHAAYCACGEGAQLGDGPRVLVCFYQGAAVWVLCITSVYLSCKKRRGYVPSASTSSSRKNCASVFTLSMPHEERNV
jgi:hypothetical protein